MPASCRSFGDPRSRGLGGASSAVRTDALDESLAAQKIYLVAETRLFEAFCSPTIGEGA